MSLNTRTARKIVVVAAVCIGVLLFGAASARPANAAAYGGAAQSLKVSDSAAKGNLPMVLVQATTEGTQASDATSAATSSTESGGDATATEAVSGASTDEGPKDAAYCLKCHGPFEKLAERTKDYITDWDEKANPHVYIPHNTKTIVDCTECHDVHAIPYNPAESLRTPNVQYCYSCHHAETLVNCNQCHNE
ncbi:MAG: cytochrome c3 family protein [Spirochaetales bacterium]|jgi:predicted CXXCH cytochrome family protein